jgi:hypothetical protein
LALVINATYPRGHFVAIADGKIVADADTFDALDGSLNALGQESADVLIVQTGIDYPESAVMFN